MRSQMAIANQAVSQLKGRVENALKVVGSPMSPAEDDLSIRTVPLDDAAPTVGGCWDYASIEGVPLVMPNVFPYYQPTLSYPQGMGTCPGGQPEQTRCARTATPAGPGGETEDAPRRGVLGEDHQPIGPQLDPRVHYSSGFMPVEPQAMQLVPSWAFIHGRPTFSSGPQPNVGGAASNQAGPVTTGGPPMFGGQLVAYSSRG